MVEKKQSAVRLWQQGKRATEIASELGISRARVYQLVAEEPRCIASRRVHMFRPGFTRCICGWATHKNEEA